MQPKQSSDLIKLAIALLDLALITAGFYLAYWLRFASWENSQSFIWLYYFSAPLILFLLLRHGALTGFRYRSLNEIIKGTFVAFLYAGLLSTAIMYMSKTTDFSRGLFSIYFGLSAVFVLLEKVLVKRLFARHLRRGGMSIRVAIIGFGERFDEILDQIAANSSWGIDPVLVVNPQEQDINSLDSLLRKTVVDEVYISYPRGPVYHEQIDGLLARLETLGLPARVALNFDEMHGYFGQHTCTLGPITAVLLAPYNLNPDQLILKRIMDLLGGFVGLVFAAALAPAIGLAIKLNSPGPIIYSQTRIGKGGRKFRIHKFRTMYVNADNDKAALKGENIHQGPLFKMRDEPRITDVGRILRKYSLDEFPQFWNVLKGEMSLVGARPPTIEEVEHYEDHHLKRICIKPGLTGLWQVSGRNTVIDFDAVVELDVDYIKRWNIWLDIEIMLRTLGVIFFPGRSGGM
jgi:exopolysaccharide biosynthesis polyprenyl glycosylphosphotransferase